MKKVNRFRLLDDFKHYWVLFLGDYNLKKYKEEKKILERYRRFLKTKKPKYFFFRRYSKFPLDLKKIERKISEEKKIFNGALFFFKKLNSFQIKKIINLVL